MDIKGTTKVTGIFGYPVEHSKSPLMHNSAFKSLGLNYVYIPFLVVPFQLKDAVESIRVLNIVGVNVTIPHKERVVKFLDGLDSTAKKIGAVNTILNKNGKLIGYNTDEYGFLKSLTSEGKFNPKNKSVFLLGCGGVAKAISVALLGAGVKTIILTDVIYGKARRLNDSLCSIYEGKKCRISVINYKDKKKIFDSINSSDIFINATPIGMNKRDGLPIQKNFLRKELFVYDVIYNRETPLLKEARRIGAKTLGGLGMLLYQGAKSFELWTGKMPPIDIMKVALKRNK